MYIVDSASVAKQVVREYSAYYSRESLIRFFTRYADEQNSIGHYWNERGLSEKARGHFDAAYVFMTALDA